MIVVPQANIISTFRRVQIVDASRYTRQEGCMEQYGLCFLSQEEVSVGTCYRAASAWRTDSARVLWEGEEKT
jgi:hypothetical protein